MIEQLKSMSAEVDRALRAYAPTKADRHDKIDQVDERRCGECNAITAGRDLGASLLRLSDALDVAIAAFERHDLMCRAA
jgi:hypothetical protein